MGDVAYFYPPAYQRSPAGSDDTLTTGSNGKPGAAGRDGASTLTGTGAPSDALGKDGDSYFALSPDGEAVAFYSPKAGGHWPAQGVPLVGTRGSPGADAPFPISGSGPPDPNNVGRPGQIYLDTVNAQIYLASA